MYGRAFLDCGVALDDLCQNVPAYARKARNAAAKALGKASAAARTPSCSECENAKSIASSGAAISHGYSLAPTYRCCCRAR
jgi:hypothetical protein